MDELIQSIITDLKAELTITDVNFDENLLTIKVKNACNEVKAERRYPSTYTDTMIATDMEKYYTNIRNIALYDYNQIGMEFQSSHKESSVQMTLVDRNSLFVGVVPLSKK